MIDVARARGETLRVADGAIEAIPTSQYPQAATRPKNSRLDTKKLREAFELSLPSWQQGVDRMLNEVLVTKEGA